MIDIYPIKERRDFKKVWNILIRVFLIAWIIYLSFPLTNVDEISLQANLLEIFGR